MNGAKKGGAQKKNRPRPFFLRARGGSAGGPAPPRHAAAASGWVRVCSRGCSQRAISLTTRSPTTKTATCRHVPAEFRKSRMTSLEGRNSSSSCIVCVISGDAGGALATRITSHPDKKKPAVLCGLEERDAAISQGYLRALRRRSLAIAGGQFPPRRSGRCPARRYRRDQSCS